MSLLTPSDGDPGGKTDTNSGKMCSNDNYTLWDRRTISYCWVIGKRQLLNPGKFRKNIRPRVPPMGIEEPWEASHKDLCTSNKRLSLLPHKCNEAHGDLSLI